MIFGASVGPFLKKAFADKAFQTNVHRIKDLLSRHPSQTGMDAVVLGPKDFSGFKGTPLETALGSKHAGIQVIFVYRRDKEAELTGDHVKKIKLDKLSPETIRTALAELLDMDGISQHVKSFVSGDDKWHQGETLPGKPAKPEDAAEEDGMIVHTATEPVASAEEQPVETETDPLERRIAEMGEWADVEYFKKMLSKPVLTDELMAENAQYAESVNMLVSLDNDIARVFQDASIPPGERFDLIKQLAIERASAQDVTHRILADKLSNVLAAVVQAAEAKVDRRIRDIRDALETVSDARLMHGDQEQLQKLIDSRMHLQLDLMELSKEIIHTYQAMDQSVSDIVRHMQDAAPTGYDHVNDLLRSTGESFPFPNNMGAIVHRLISDLQNGQIAFSIVEKKIKDLLVLVFKLCEEDATIIDYQQKLIRLLQAQKVENIVLVDHAIKNVLSLFVGASDTGRTATALIWSGLVARRRNTLLLDLTGQSKLQHYGIDSVPLDQFMANRLERPFLCVEGTIKDEQALSRLIDELKTRLNYYGHIHVLLDAARADLVNEMAKSALQVHWVTDCSFRATEQLRLAIEGFKAENVALKAVLVDPPVAPIRIISDMGLDPLVTKAIVVPKLNAVKASSLDRVIPYEKPEIAEIYEEAFR